MLYSGKDKIPARSKQRPVRQPAIAPFGKTEQVFARHLAAPLWLIERSNWSIAWTNDAVDRVLRDSRPTVRTGIRTWIDHAWTNLAAGQRVNGTWHLGGGDASVACVLSAARLDGDAEAVLIEAVSVPDQEGGNRYLKAIEASNNWVWETDAELRFTFMSRNVEQIVGVPAVGWGTVS